MYDTLGVYSFLIVMGLLLAAMFLGLGICLGREYERIIKEHSKQNSKHRCNNKCIYYDMDNNDSDSDVGNIHL